MSFIIRKIRKSKWYKHDGVPWLTEGEIQADALSDLSTKSNKLSVWLVLDDKTNFEQIIAVLATSNTDRVPSIDYALIEEKLLNQLFVKQEESLGDSPNNTANNSWHIDLIDITTEKLFKIAQLISTHGQIDRIMDKDVLKIVQEGVRSGDLDLSKMNEDLKRSIFN